MISQNNNRTMEDFFYPELLEFFKENLLSKFDLSLKDKKKIPAILIQNGHIPNHYLFYDENVSLFAIFTISKSFIDEQTIQNIVSQENGGHIIIMEKYDLRNSFFDTKSRNTLQVQVFEKYGLRNSSTDTKSRRPTIKKRKNPYPGNNKNATMIKRNNPFFGNNEGVETNPFSLNNPTFFG